MSKLWMMRYGDVSLQFGFRMGWLTCRHDDFKLRISVKTSDFDMFSIFFLF